MVDLIYDDFEVNVNVSFNTETRSGVNISDVSHLSLVPAEQFIGFDSVNCSLVGEVKHVTILEDGETVVEKKENSVGIDSVVLTTNVGNKYRPLLNYIEVFQCVTDTVTDHSFEYLLRMDIDNFCHNAVKKDFSYVTTVEDGYVRDYDFWFDSTSMPVMIRNNTKNTYFIVLILLYENRDNDRLWVFSLTDDWDIGNDFIVFEASFGSHMTGLKGYFGFVRANPHYGFMFNGQYGNLFNSYVEQIGYVACKYVDREYRNYTYIPLNCYDTSLFHAKLEEKLANQ